MFNNYKEIVTKTIIGKGKKEFKNTYKVKTDKKVDTVLGCWVINHKIKGSFDNDYIKINGSFDVNIWYSYDNNTKTDVINDSIVYEERVRVRLKDNSYLNDNSQVIVRSLKSPSCINVSNDNYNIEYIILKELGIEIVGDQVIRIPISNSEDEYDVIIDEDEVSKQIDASVNEDYLTDNK